MNRFSLALASLALLSACGNGESDEGATELVQIDGSSTVFPIVEAIAEEFQRDFRGRYQVTVGVSGTGGGFKKFCRGETALSNASRPIRTSELALCAENGVAFIELPIALDALAVVVNPANDWVDHLSVEELRTMWAPEAQGKILSWRQIRESFPDRPLALFGAGADSGTYDYFTQAIVGKEHESRGDYTASEDDNVLVMGVATDVGALGFFGYAYLNENRDKLKPVPIKYGEAAPVAPSFEAASNGTYQPLSRPLFLYINSRAADESPAVRQFVDYFLDPALAAELVEEVGYIPLPPEAYVLARRKFDDRRTGTVFEGGSQVGVSIEDLLDAERAE